MIIVLKPGAQQADAQQLLDKIETAGLKPLYMPGSERIVLGALGDERVLKQLQLQAHPMVDSVKPILSQYKLVSRELNPADSVVQIGSVPVGADTFTVIAGPCAVEGLDAYTESASAAVSAGATVLRGGAFKPRTSPYSFQGDGQTGLAVIKQVKQQLGVPAVTEIVDVADLEGILEHADAVQVGARNMQNYQLLKALGAQTKPVVLKRGMAATIDEFLLAAEYIVNAGNPNVILCERGIRTFETTTRNTLDLAAVAYIKQRCHLPVLVDPSHGTGIRELVGPMAKAAAAVGADGVMIEVHHQPELALSDGQQSLTPNQFQQLMRELQGFVEAAGRHLVLPEYRLQAN